MTIPKRILALASKFEKFAQNEKVYVDLEPRPKPPKARYITIVASAVYDDDTASLARQAITNVKNIVGGGRIENAAIGKEEKNNFLMYFSPPIPLNLSRKPLDKVVAELSLYKKWLDVEVYSSEGSTNIIKRL